MNDDLDDLEQALGRHRPPTPPERLRRRIVALPRQASPGVRWQGIAAAVLAVLALADMVASSGMPAAPERSTSAVQVAVAVRELGLPLSEGETRLLAQNLDAGSRLNLLPQIHGRPRNEKPFGEMP